MAEFNNQRSFMTHHGLKVRIDHDFCTKNMPQKNVFPWYTSIEAFDSLSGILAIFIAIYAVIENLTFISAFTLIIVGYLLGYLVSQSNLCILILNWPYGTFYMFYSFLNRFLIDIIAFGIFAFLSKHLEILLAYFVARIVCFVISSILNIVLLKLNLKKYGVALGDVELIAFKTLLFYSNEPRKYQQLVREYLAYLNKQ